MDRIIKFFNKWGTTIVASLVTLLLICTFICNLSLVFSHFALLLSLPGTFGATCSLALSIFLLIEEIKEARKL